MAQDPQYPAPTRSSRRQAGLPPTNTVEHPQNNQVLPQPEQIFPNINQTGYALPAPQTPITYNQHVQRDPMVETASASQFSSVQNNPPSHMSGHFMRPNPSYAPHPYMLHPYPNQSVYSGPPSVTHSFQSSASTLPGGSLTGTISSHTDSSFLRAQINHLTEDKRLLETKLTQVITQLEQTNKNSERQFNTLMEQMQRKEDENSRLLKLLISQQKPPQQHDLIDFFLTGFGTSTGTPRN